MKNLHLTLKKEPFEVMITGEKKIEVRRPSNWILPRLKSGKPDLIKFTNGCSMEKREITKEEAIQEAKRYLANAKDILKGVAIEDNRYMDDKYVRTAAGIAYLAPLKAIDGYFLGKKRNDDKMPESIEHYRSIIKKYHPNQRRILDLLDTAYENLHILAYYRGGVNVDMVKSGLQAVKSIIEEIDPNYRPNPKNK